MREIYIHRTRIFTSLEFCKEYVQHAREEV